MLIQEIEGNVKEKVRKLNEVVAKYIQDNMDKLEEKIEGYV